MRCVTLTSVNKRVNIVLPERTLKTIDRIVKPGGRSHFINEAVTHFVTHRSAEALRSRLEQAAVRDRDLDREITADWSDVDKEAWQKPDIEPVRKLAGPGEARSTSRRSTRR